MLSGAIPDDPAARSSAVMHRFGQEYGLMFAFRLSRRRCAIAELDARIHSDFLAQLADLVTMENVAWRQRTEQEVSPELLRNS